jgi:predicted dehydrogenase
MKMKGAIIGCGFFASNHMHAWKELNNVEIVAACDLNLNKVESFCNKFHIPNQFTSIEKMIQNIDLDFVDVVTTMETHLDICKILSFYKIPTSLQKPFSNTFQNAKKIVNLYKKNKTKLMIHENFRWQTPIVRLKKLLKLHNLGTPLYSKISFRHANPVGYINQEYLYDLKEYLILDVGIHLYDLARFFMGEAHSVYTINQNTNKKFKGETAFTSLLRHSNKSVSIVDASISSIKKPDCFAQTLITLECKNGTAILDYNYNITIHKNKKKLKVVAQPKKYKWTKKPWDQIQESIINTHKHFIYSLLNNITSDTNGEDNLKSLNIVFASYKSNTLNKEIDLKL